MLPSHKLPFSFCMHGQTCARLAPQCSLGWFQFNLWLCKLTVNANNSGLYQSQSTENGRNGLSLARNAAICQVVHFPEIITVRVRNNLLEGNVLGPRKMRCQTVTTNNQWTKTETKQIESHEYIYIFDAEKGYISTCYNFLPGAHHCKANECVRIWRSLQSPCLRFSCFIVSLETGDLQQWKEWSLGSFVKMCERICVVQRVIQQ